MATLPTASGGTQSVSLRVVGRADQGRKDGEGGSQGEREEGVREATGTEMYVMGEDGWKVRMGRKGDMAGRDGG